jgi:prepilin-type processing-associated H-X9-DG protein/prepilin-type N-terminal cleavage/methylation domain-containing protein
MRFRRGFTLIEILTVIGIVVTLAGTIFAMLGSSKGRAKLVACATNLNQIGKAVVLYASDNDDFAPPFLNFPTDRSMGLYANVGDNPWRNSLVRYAGSTQVFYCPEDPFALRESGDRDASQVDHRVTSYANSPWLQKQVVDGVLSLNLSGLEDAADAEYLRDDATEARRVGRMIEMRTPHDNRPNALFLDGHTARAKSAP